MVINRTYHRLLEKNGFDGFEQVWGISNAKTIKKIKARSVIRFEMRTDNGKRYFYLKRHNLEYIGIKRLFSAIFPKWAMSQGLREFENICDFRKINLKTVSPVAAGQRFKRFFWAESFLITEDFSPFFSLEDLIRFRPDFLKGPERKERKRILLRECALLARRMHKAGLNHLDFNATHIILHYDNGTKTPEIALFDFQRVDRGTFLRLRWMVKSLARLNQTLPDNIFDEEDRIYIFLSYKEKDRFSLLERVEWLWLKRKTERIKRHTRKLFIKREENRRKGESGQ